MHFRDGWVTLWTLTTITALMISLPSCVGSLGASGKEVAQPTPPVLITSKVTFDPQAFSTPACTGCVVTNITVGHGAEGLAYDSSNGEVYVANEGDNTVSVINGSTETVVKTISVGKWPVAIGYDSDNGQIYVANSGNDTVSIISGASDSVSATIGVNGNPYGVLYDGDTGDMYVATFTCPGNICEIPSPQTNISVVSGASSSIIGVITVSGSGDMAFDQLNGDIYFSDNPTGEVTVISATTNEIVSTIDVGGYPCGVSVDNESGNIFVANGDCSGNDASSTGSISIVSGAGNTVTGTIPVSIGSPSWMSFDSRDGDIYAATCGLTGKIDVISSISNQVVSEIAVGTDIEGLVLDSGSNLVYVTSDHDLVNVISPNLPITPTSSSASGLPVWIYLTSVAAVAIGVVIALKLTLRRNSSRTNLGYVSPPSPPPPAGPPPTPPQER